MAGKRELIQPHFPNPQYVANEPRDRAEEVEDKPFRDRAVRKRRRTDGFFKFFRRKRVR